MEVGKIATIAAAVLCMVLFIILALDFDEIEKSNWKLIAAGESILGGLLVLILVL